MERDLDRAVLVSIEGRRRGISLDVAAAAIHAELGLTPVDMSIRAFDPADFLVLCRSLDVRDRLLHAVSISSSSCSLSFAPWSRSVGGVLREAPFLAEVELRGIPAHAWAEGTAVKLFEGSGIVDEVDQATANRFDMSCFRLSVWTHDVTSIPAVRWLAVPEPGLGNHLTVASGRRRPRTDTPKVTWYKIRFWVSSWLIGGVPGSGDSDGRSGRDVGGRDAAPAPPAGSARGERGRRRRRRKAPRRGSGRREEGGAPVLRGPAAAVATGSAGALAATATGSPAVPSAGRWAPPRCPSAEGLLTTSAVGSRCPSLADAASSRGLGCVSPRLACLRVSCASVCDLGGASQRGSPRSVASCDGPRLAAHWPVADSEAAPMGRGCACCASGGGAQGAVTCLRGNGAALHAAHAFLSGSPAGSGEVVGHVLGSDAFVREPASACGPWSGHISGAPEAGFRVEVSSLPLSPHAAHGHALTPSGVGPARVGDVHVALAAPSGPLEVDEGRSADVRQSSHDAATLMSLLRQLRVQLDDPLLPMPDPKVVRRRLFAVSTPATRRSRRIAAIGKGINGSVVKRAQRLLMQKLGLCHAEERISAKHLQEYAAIFASPLGPEQVAALTALFGLDCPAVGEDALAAVVAAQG